MSQSTPNFYAIIPATVRYCKDLPPMARLLYGEITALANKEGYCWASNKHFEELYSTNDRTVRRWLDALQRNGFIKIEITNGIQVSRKIWIITAVKKTPTGQKCPGVRTKMPGGEDKNVRHNIKYNNTSNKNNDVPKRVQPPKTAASISSSFFLKDNQSKDESRILLLQTTERANTSINSEKSRFRRETAATLSSDQFELGYECYCEAKKTQAIRNPAAWITTAALRKFSAKKDESEEIRKAAEKIEQYFAIKGDVVNFRVVALSKYLEVYQLGQGKNACIFYSNRSFQNWLEDIETHLQKFGFPNKYLQPLLDKIEREYGNLNVC